MQIRGHLPEGSRVHSVTWHPHGHPTDSRHSWYFSDGLIHLTLEAARDLRSTALVLVGRAGVRLGADGPTPLVPGEPQSGRSGSLLWRPVTSRAELTEPLRGPATRALPHEPTASGDGPGDDPYDAPDGEPTGGPGGKDLGGPRGRETGPRGGPPPAAPLHDLRGPRPPAFALEVEGRLVPLPANGVVLVGRHPHCHIRLYDRSVSGYHCALAVDGGGVRVVDLRSRHGTWVADARVHAAYLTQPTAVRLAHRHLSLRLGDEPSGNLVRLPSAAMDNVYQMARRIAPNRAPVVIHGETGTGKEGLAHAIHRWSGRKGRFVAINAAVLSSNLAASELFGHVRGAFTGADEARPGAFATADKGTLFLDEIAELRSEVQAELLRVLETREVRPVGSSQNIPVDVRLVTATHCDLAQRVAEGRFREDLFHRIYVLNLDLPPLRERTEDIDAIIDAVLGRQCPPRRMGRRARSVLHAHPWRGNIRELINVLERTCILTDGLEIRAEHLSLRSTVSPAARTSGLKRASVVAAYRRHEGNANAAARELGIHRATLFRYLRQARLAGEMER